MSRRDKIRLSDAEIRDFLEQSKTVILCSNGKDGHPHVMPMWFRLTEEGVIEMTTYARSQKVLNLRRDPSATLLVESGTDYAELRGVMMNGVAEIVDDQERILDTLMRASGDPSSPGDADRLEKLRESMRGTAAKRVLIRVKPERVVSWDHARLGGVY